MTRALTAKAIQVTLGGNPILNGVSASFAPGTVTAIVGPNGAGKTTLMACLAGLRAPDAGEVRLGDDPLDRMPPRRRARRIGYLPQLPEVAWAVTVETLVGLGRIPHSGAMGLSDEDRAAVSRALTTTNLNIMADRDVTTLSGGERARALIARALAGEPAWLLADEPLTGLDPGHQFDVAELFRGLAQAGRGVVLTLHDLGFAARIADRVIVLKDGAILADGTPEIALSAGSLAAAYGIAVRVTAGAAGPVIEILGRHHG
jgi:iron complex transport system ATP-binding protein